MLEKAGIPVDIVTGTSIGSIIGGLYAIGYNAHSLDSMVRTQDWTYVITDKEDLGNQSLLDRKKLNTYLFNTGMTFGKRDRGAGGLIRGKNLAELFQKLFVGYTDSLDFNKDLKIPFACVATNIMDNSEVVFHSGRLPQATGCLLASETRRHGAGRWWPEEQFSRGRGSRDGSRSRYRRHTERQA